MKIFVCFVYLADHFKRFANGLQSGVQNFEKFWHSTAKSSSLLINHIII